MVATREDEELTELLTKLYGIQEDIGAKPKTTEEEKRSKAENAAKMGTTKKAEKKIVKAKKMSSSSGGYDLDLDGARPAAAKALRKVARFSSVEKAKVAPL